MRNDKKRVLRRVKQVLIPLFVTVAGIGLLVAATYGHDMPVLNTKGLIADQERNLILLTFGLGLVVVIPVFIMLFSIAWKYRATNTKAKYQPELGGHKGLEALWWGIPIIIIVILAVITGISTHALDPYKPISSHVPAVRVQVVAMNWKWLFIYPDQSIATLNYLNIPKDTPIDFTITSDAAMNSFWVPALAGQIYAMSGMTTQLHLQADSVGTFNGSSANISGKGFADMNFKVNAMTEADFKKWSTDMGNSTSTPLLTDDVYKKLSQPSVKNPDTAYLLMDHNLYNEVIMKYMSPNGSNIGVPEAQE